MVDYMLTTIDNPYSPFDDFKRWMSYDHQLGHYTSELLARVVVTSDELSEKDQEEAIDSAMNEIVLEDPLLIYRKVSRSSVLKLTPPIDLDSV